MAMQPISEVIKALKKQYGAENVYPFESSDDITVVQPGKKRGKQAVLTLSLEEARALVAESSAGPPASEAQRITFHADDLTIEEMAVVGLDLFFEKMGILARHLEEEARLMAEMEHEEAMREAEARKPRQEKAYGHPICQLDLAGRVYNFFANGLGEETTVGELRQGLIVGWADLPPGASSAAAEAVLNYTDTWHSDTDLVRVAKATRALFLAAEAKEREQAKIQGRLKQIVNGEIAKAKNLIEDVSGDADEVERKHRGARAGRTSYTGSPVARFVVAGKTYTRKMRYGDKRDVNRLKADIVEKWGEAKARNIFTTLRVGWSVPVLSA